MILLSFQLEARRVDIFFYQYLYHFVMSLIIFYNLYSGDYYQKNSFFPSWLFFNFSYDRYKSFSTRSMYSSGQYAVLLISLGIEPNLKTLKKPKKNLCNILIYQILVFNYFILRYIRFASEIYRIIEGIATSSNFFITRWG